MKLKNQLKKLQELLDSETRERSIYRQDMKTLLRKMKLKENNMSEKAKTESDEATRELLMKKIDMLHAQRRKGIQALRKMNAK